MDSLSDFLLVIFSALLPGLVAGFILGSRYTYHRIDAGTVAGYHYFHGTLESVSVQVAHVLEEVGVKNVFLHGFSDTYVPNAVEQAMEALTDEQAVDIIARKSDELHEKYSPQSSRLSVRGERLLNRVGETDLQPVAKPSPAKVKSLTKRPRRNLGL